MLSANLDHLEIIPFISAELKQLLKDAKEFLSEDREAGRYDLEGDKVFAMVVDAQTQPIEERRPEFHADYADIQVLLEGTEVLGYGHMPAGAITEDKMADKDVAFTAEIAAEKTVLMAPRDFAVFFPGELHRPLVAPDGKGASVRKAIFKVHRSVLEPS